MYQDMLDNPFQCSSASRKFLNRGGGARQFVERRVSVLFSEPKIPQWGTAMSLVCPSCGFSALQRAENSSIRKSRAAATRAPAFQCSSASRKFLNTYVPDSQPYNPNSFSALQRAENSSIGGVWRFRLCPTRPFQCSSASRKFLNVAPASVFLYHTSHVSVLFSEPKIPQSRAAPARYEAPRVSVLFSEPKIPQL